MHLVKNLLFMGLWASTLAIASTPLEAQEDAAIVSAPIAAQKDVAAIDQPDESADNDQASQVHHDPAPVSPPEGKVPASIIQLGGSEYYSPYTFVVDKSKRTLSVWRQTEDDILLLGAYPSDMGRKTGDKNQLGDLRTPEGVYFFQEMYEGTNLDYENYGVRAFTMDYPNFFDRREKKTGSGIWLHAIPETKTLERGSRGCVVVRNDVIKSLSHYITLKKTPIVVEDQVRFISKDEHKTMRQKLLGWLESWRKSWSSKDLDRYIEHYSDAFKAMKMDKEKWRQYKAGLNKRYEYIDVKIKQPIVLKHDNEYVIRFLQEYHSDSLSDFGEKFLYLRAEGDGDFRIVGEEWSAIRNDDLLAQKVRQSQGI